MLLKLPDNLAPQHFIKYMGIDPSTTYAVSSHAWAARWNDAPALVASQCSAAAKLCCWYIKSIVKSVKLNTEIHDMHR